jgi:outer membrane biosynthesis protein TonB
VEDSRDLVMDSYAGDVRRVIRQYYSARAGNCYERATRNNAFLRGTVVIAFTIGLEGNVTNARSVHNTTGDEPLAACLAGQVGSWRLPPPPRDRPVNFEMPFSW